MRPAENIEKLVKNIDIDTNAKIDKKVLGDVAEAFEKSKVKKTSAIEQNIGRIIMKSKITKLATAAVIIAAIMLGIHALVGSGTSITMAQVRQAMQDIDWMQIINKSKIEEGVEIDWYSFASKIEIKADAKGTVSYSDFKAHKQFFWPGEGKYIIESPIDQTKEFAHGTSGPFEMIDKGFKAVHGKDVVREIGTYQGQKVEVWTAIQVKYGSTRTIIVYFDIDRKLPVAATFKREGTDTVNPEENYIEFKYPETGPADIYEAGAPRSAQIKPAPEH